MKNLSTTSIILNVIASFIALILFTGSIGLFFKLELISGFSILAGSILLSPLAKLIFNKYENNTIRLIRVISPMVLLFIGSISSGSTLNESDKDSKTSEKRELTILKDSLNQALGAKDLSVCLVIDEVSKIESQAIKEADKKYPDYGQKHNNYTYELIEKRTDKYVISKKIDSITYDKIMIFVMECTESERQARIDKLKIQKISH